MPLSRLLFDKISYLDPQAHVNIVLSLLKLTLDSVKVVVIDPTISFLINITTSTFAISFLSFYRFWSVLPTNQHLIIQLQTRQIKKKKALATHDFAGNFYLIWFIINCKTSESIYARPWIFHNGLFKRSILQSKTFWYHSEVVNLEPTSVEKCILQTKMQLSLKNI